MSRLGREDSPWDGSSSVKKAWGGGTEKSQGLLDAYWSLQVPKPGPAIPSHCYCSHCFVLFAKAVVTITKTKNKQKKTNTDWVA